MNKEHEKILFSQILKLVKRSDSLMEKIDDMKSQINEMKRYVKSLEILKENSSSVSVTNASETQKSGNAFSGMSDKSPLFDILSSVKPLEEDDGEKSILESDNVSANTPEAQNVLNKIQSMFKG